MVVSHRSNAWLLFARRVGPPIEGAGSHTHLSVTARIDDRTATFPSVAGAQPSGMRGRSPVGLSALIAEDKENWTFEGFGQLEYPVGRPGGAAILRLIRLRGGMKRRRRSRLRSVRSIRRPDLLQSPPPCNPPLSRHEGSAIRLVS